MGHEMNTSDGIPSCTVLEYAAQGSVEVASVAVREHQVKWIGPRMTVPSSPILRGIAPETPNLWSPRGDLEPMMANEEEVVRSLIQPVKIPIEGDIPGKDTTKYFGWEFGNVQKRVPGVFELGDGLLVLSDLIIQSAYGIDVGLAVHSVFRPCQH